MSCLTIITLFITVNNAVTKLCHSGYWKCPLWLERRHGDVCVTGQWPRR